MVTLYLNPEGILHPLHAAAKRGTTSESFADNIALFEELLLSSPPTAIVLHSWYILEAGYREALSCLPSGTRASVIGATLPGNRLHRYRHPVVTARREWLRADLQRRRPPRPVLLDTDWGQVLPVLCESSIILEGRADLANAIHALRTLLLEAATGSGRSDRDSGDGRCREEQA